MKMKRFPIVDIQFHREGLDELSDEYTDSERNVLTMWHTTAIQRLHCGASWGLPGPAAIDYDNGRTAKPIEDVLTLVRDSRGQASFVHTFKV